MANRVAMTLMKLTHRFDKLAAPELEQFRGVILDTAANMINGFMGNLARLHEVTNVGDDINRLRLECFRRVNNELNWPKMIWQLCGEELCGLMGRDLLIQTKINVSIQMPQDVGSVLQLHSDSWSADSPFQMNLWIPLTDAYSTNSMFILGVDETLHTMEEISKSDLTGIAALESLRVDESQFVRMKFGEILVFNPALLHGNVKNLTESTRVSLNVRVKPIFAPEPGARNPDRRAGTYYKLLNISENTDFALKFLGTGILK